MDKYEEIIYRPKRTVKDVLETTVLFIIASVGFGCSFGLIAYAIKLYVMIHQ